MRMKSKRKSVSQMQNEVVSYYLDEFKSDKDTDVKIMIEQAKALKDMIVNESLKGNFTLLKHFDRIGQFLLTCYEQLPHDSDERTNIEQAIAILSGLKKEG